MSRAGPRQSRNWRRIAVMLAVVAVALRLAVPPGFMLAAEPGSGPRLIPCSGHVSPPPSHHTMGHAHDGVAPHHQALHDPAQAPGDKVCPFAPLAAAGPAPLTSDAGVLAPISYRPAAPPPQADTTRALGLAARPPPARGPPLSPT